jgi:hypothetical protein
VFHFPFLVGVHAIELIAIIVVPAFVVARFFVSVPLSEVLRVTLLIFIAAILFFAVYNLQQFHYTSEGGIVTRGLFGVDIPFLAGEVHGLRNFGELRDLHQAAQPWHYHDATYRLLAHFNADTTIGDIAFAAPLAGYTLLALSVFALVLRATKRRDIAWMAVLAWFVASGWAGIDTSSYALSPSFVFGSVLLVNIILLLEIARERSGAARTTLLVIALLLTIALAETKITSFLVIVAALMLMALFKALRKSWRSALEYAILSIVPLCVLALISKADPLMPAGDFLVGAPLMGYANHLASMLHTPLASLNPVTHATLSIKSLLILPYFVFHFLRFIVLDPRLIAAALIIFIARPKSELSILLAIIIPLGFFLPVLYSPAWYPLALSFYAPLVSIQAAVLLVAINWRSIQSTVPRITLAVLFGAAVAAGLFQIVVANRTTPTSINATFVQAMDSIADKLPATAIMVTHRHDLDAKDESYYWYAALAGRAVVSEGAKYGALLGAVADVDAAKGLHRVAAADSLLAFRRAIIDTIYNSADSAHVSQALHQWHTQYILIDHTNADALRCTATFDTVFSNSAMTLLR